MILLPTRPCLEQSLRNADFAPAARVPKIGGSPENRRGLVRCCAGGTLSGNPRMQSDCGTRL